MGWMETGLDFGYPKCCVDYFCSENFNPKKDNFRLKGKLNVSGFIPCPKHKKQIIAGKITLSSLIDYSKRKVSEKFKEEYILYKGY